MNPAVDIAESEVLGEARVITTDAGHAFFDPKIIEHWERENANRHARWVESLKHRTVAEVADAARGTSGGALLVWMDERRELQARTISREDSIIRDFVPAHLRRTR